MLPKRSRVFAARTRAPPVLLQFAGRSFGPTAGPSGRCSALRADVSRSVFLRARRSPWASECAPPLCRFMCRPGCCVSLFVWFLVFRSVRRVFSHVSPRSLGFVACLVPCLPVCQSVPRVFSCVAWGLGFRCLSARRSVWFAYCSPVFSVRLVLRSSANLYRTGGATYLVSIARISRLCPGFSEARPVLLAVCTW